MESQRRSSRSPRPAKSLVWARLAVNDSATSLHRSMSLESMNECRKETRWISSEEALWAGKYEPRLRRLAFVFDVRCPCGSVAAESQAWAPGQGTTTASSCLVRRILHLTDDRPIRVRSARSLAVCYSAVQLIRPAASWQGCVAS